MVYRKRVFNFGEGFPPPPLDIDLLGSKGLGLAEMAAMELPVPSGFLITTEACNSFRREKELDAALKEEVLEGGRLLERQTQLKFGCPEKPLFVSVRSSGAISMPGMMETILNLGFNDQTVKAFAQQTGNEQLAYNLYRNFLMKFGELVFGIERSRFGALQESIKKQEGAELEIDLSVDGLKELCSLFKELYPFSQCVETQLFQAISAVFASWDAPRTALYRRVHNLPDSWGTAVAVQTMAFGNRSQNSAAGIAFTRSPITGKSQLTGEFLLNAQGEELEQGLRMPHPLREGGGLKSLERLMPGLFGQLADICAKLETYLRDMQDIEFTVEEGKLYLLQTRPGKRTAVAAVRIAAEMLLEDLIDEETALKRLREQPIPLILMPASSPISPQPVAKGCGAVPGAATGKAAFTLPKALEYKKKEIPFIFVGQAPSPDDFPALAASSGILALSGGIASHAAFTARGLGKPCVVGCRALHLNRKNDTLACGTQAVKEGDPISIDGTTGQVYFQELPLVPSPYFEQLVEVARQSRFEEIRSVLDPNYSLA